MKKYYIFIIFMLVLLVSSCSSGNESAADEAVDGIAFDYFVTYEIEGINYDIYFPTDVDSSLYYTNKLGKIYSSSNEWTVNFIYEAEYHLDESKETKEVWIQFYEKISESKDILNQKCKFDVMLFDPYSSVELEYVLHNNTVQESTYVVFVTYLPIRLVNNFTRRTSTIGIPVKLDVLLKIGDMVENPFNDEMMSWEDFLAI